MNENQKKLEKRVIQVAGEVLYKKQWVCCIDVLLVIGYLNPTILNDWRKGKVPNLEKVLQANLAKISRAMKIFRCWAIHQNLKPSQTVYLAKTRGPKRFLQFSKSGNPQIEHAYRTHYVSPDLSEKKQQNLKEKLASPPEKVAFITISDSE